VLHRDLSKGNILFVPPGSKGRPTTTNEGSTVASDGNGEVKRYGFVASLLGKRYAHTESSFVDVHDELQQSRSLADIGASHRLQPQRGSRGRSRSASAGSSRELTTVSYRVR
jgi:hypothetical protein